VSDKINMATDIPGLRKPVEQEMDISGEEAEQQLEETEQLEADSNEDVTPEDNADEGEAPTEEAEPNPEVETLRQQMAQLQQKLDAQQSQETKQQEQQKIDQVLKDLSDKDIVDGADAAEALKQIIDLSKAQEPQADALPAYETDVSNQWTMSRPDYQKVVQQVEGDQTLAQKVTTLPTNSVGVYYAVKAEQAKGEVARKEKVIQDLQAKLAKQSKGPVPPTGAPHSGQRRAGGQQQTGGLTKGTAQFLNGLNGLGAGLTIEKRS